MSKAMSHFMNAIYPDARTVDTLEEELMLRASRLQMQLVYGSSIMNVPIQVITQSISSTFHTQISISNLAMWLKLVLVVETN